MTLFLTAFSMCLVVSFAFSIYFVFSAAFKTYTVFITGININLPPANTSDIDTASDRLLNLPLDLMTASVSDMVDAAILLNIVLPVPTVSDNDIDCDIALNEPYSLDTESDNDIDSDAVLIALYTLATLSFNETDVAVMLLKNDSIDPTESDRDMLCEMVLVAPYNRAILSFNDILSVNPLIELYILVALSDNDILGSVIVSLLISLLANESVIGCDCIVVSNGGELKYAVSNRAPKS